MTTHSRYAIQAVLVYIAIGVAIGMVGWALLIHDSGSSSADRTPAKVAPATGDSQR